MKPLDRDELFHHLKGFLRSKGVELQEGSYSSGIRSSCSLLSDAINLGQQGLDRAKTEVDKKLDRMRQVIHQKTAPRKPSGGANPAPPTANASTGAASKAVKPKRAPRRKAKPAK
jgi:ribosomal protein S20